MKLKDMLFGGYRLPSDKERQEAWFLGSSDQVMGKSIKTNPYAPGGHKKTDGILQQAWNDGWMNSHTKRWAA